MLKNNLKKKFFLTCQAHESGQPAKHMNISINFIKFNNMNFIWNYFFYYMKKIKEKKRVKIDIKKEEKRHLTKPVNRVFLK